MKDMRKVLLLLLALPGLALGTQTSPLTAGQLLTVSSPSGGTITGTSGETCNATTGFNDSLSGASLTFTLTASNTLSGATVAINTPGNGATAAPTSGTLSSGTATCSGTVTFTSTLGSWEVIGATYTSGGTISGSAGQTCTVTFTAPSSPGVTAVGTVVLTSTNTIASGTPITITTYGGNYSSAPTSGTFTSGTGTCSGTPTVTSTLLANTQLRWVVFQTGSNSNAGCFDPSLGGTDYSNQAAAQVTFSSGNSNLLSVTAASTTVTSAGTPFTSAMVGNCIQVATLTNGPTLPQVFEIISFISSSSVVVDRTPCPGSTNCTSGAGALGGALATLDSSAGLLFYQEGTTTAYIKGNANYTGTSTLTLPPGIPGWPTYWKGFSSTFTDSGVATLAPSSSVSGNFATCATFNFFQNIFIEGGSSFFVATAFNCAAPNVAYLNDTANHFSTRGFSLGQGDRVTLSLAENGKSACTAGFGIGSTIFALANVATANNCTGFQTTTNGFAGPILAFNLSYANVGSTSHGFDQTAGTAVGSGPWLLNNVAYGNGGSGFHFTAADSLDNLTAYNNISEGNSRYGWESVVTQWNVLLFDYNASYNNTLGDLLNMTHGAHDACASGCNTTYNAEAFANPGSGNFALNSTSGGGAALQGMGLPGAFPLALSTGFLSPGAVQPSASAVSGCVLSNSVVSNCAFK